MSGATKLPPQPRPKATTIKFEDHGQDFLEWDLDDEGEVIACRPHQEVVWKGVKVLNHDALRCGSTLQLQLSDGRRSTLNYRVAIVGRLARAQRRA